MATYYFTYGVGDCKGQAYQYGGWTEVEAENAEQAVALYKVFHPLVNGLLPCCGVALSKDEMAEDYMGPGSNMLAEGNGRKFCRDRITARREVF